MDLEDEISKAIDEEKTGRLGDGVYGLRHELIGKPCLYNNGGTLHPAIPYGSYRLAEGEEFHVHGLKKRGQLLSILWYVENEPAEGINVKVKAMSGVLPDNLITLDTSSRKGQEVYHTILSWLASNRAGTFKHQEKEPITS